ncbi:MAG: hypothetical protein RMJ66_00485 [Bacteroidia bacterium]|nr:hypothetical protein [Bacteroidia bacterium]MDW8133521.1 hypothetical protein [Bacteroidia bacterium]
MWAFIWSQVGLWCGWGGHTSQNDLVALAERWHRFYGWGGVGVRFIPTRRLQPMIYWEGGQFISQDRNKRAFSRTRWGAVGIGLRLRFLRKGFSPILETTLGRLTASPRTMEGRPITGSPASLSANFLGWGAGISWRLNEWVELGLLYLRRRPQTSALEGISGPARDRLEGFMGQLTLLLGEKSESSSRFQ